METARGVGNTLNPLSALYPGYSGRYLGSVVGLAYGFASAGLGGGAFGWLYSRVAGTTREAEKQSA